MGQAPKGSIDEAEAVMEQQPACIGEEETFTLGPDEDNGYSDMQMMVNKYDATVQTNNLQTAGTTASRETEFEDQMGEIKIRYGRTIVHTRKWIESQEQNEKGKNM